jgi:GNAT superfamily N-acetyltransferase
LELRVRVRPLTRGEEENILLVASRMRQTLAEVLGEERGTGLYSLDWLRNRVLFHLDTGQVLLAESAGQVLGHCMLRVEGDIGLYATTFVRPESRRAGVAQALLSAGEVWLVAQGVQALATDTALENTKLIRLFESRGFKVVHTTQEMLRLSRAL